MNNRLQTLSRIISNIESTAEQKNWTHTELAYRVGISENQLFCIRGGRRTPGVKVLGGILSLEDTQFSKAIKILRKNGLEVVALILEYLRESANDNGNKKDCRD